MDRVPAHTGFSLQSVIWNVSAGAREGPCLSPESGPGEGFAIVFGLKHWDP